MATGPLRFRTPHIEELPVAHSRQAPGFAWVAVTGPAAADPAKNWGTANRKRQRTLGGLGQSESQREALSARQQRDVEKRVKELNSDPAKDATIPIPKKDSGAGVGGGAARAGRTPNTKKILASGKTFAHYLDDEEAEIARTGGRREIDLDPQPLATAAAATTPRVSKTPIARRKSHLAKNDSSASTSPAPALPSTRHSQDPPFLPLGDTMDLDDDNDNDTRSGNDEHDAEFALLSPPSRAEIEALLAAPPLTYNQARSAPPPPSAPPPRRFCEICGFWGRVRCMKCGAMTCTVLCKDAHDEHKCLKFYA